MKLRWKKGTAGEQRGAFIVFTALAIWFLMMFVAFAVDFGNYYQHRARLQNAADAAALAGVAKYADSELFDYTMTEKGKGRLVKIPANITGGADGQPATFSADNYTFTKLEDVPGEVHQQGLDYVDSNYRRGLGIKEDSMWSATQESTSSTTTQTAGGAMQNQETTSLSKQYCYRVDLEDKVTTFFARIFSKELETLTVHVSAMAMLDGTKSTTVEELLPMISGHINDIIPNYYWESIAYYPSKIYEGGVQVATTGKPDPKNPNNKFTNQAYGKTNLNYLLTDSKFDYTDIVWGARPEVDFATGQYTGRYIIGYKDTGRDGTDLTEDKEGVCAVPIYAEGPVNENDVLTQVFKFESDSSVLYGVDKDIIGLFLDRDNVVKKIKYDTLPAEHKERFKDDEYVVKNGLGYGQRDRFVDIYIGKITRKPNVPIYARLESEPVRIGERGVTSTCGITFYITLHENSYNNIDEIKPFVFAYDGPDPNRGLNDAPWVATSQVGLDYKNNSANEYELSAGQIEERAEPLYNSFATKSNPPKPMPLQMVESSRATPGPIVVYIPQGHVFKGVIWAPRSKVTIIGGGKIIGFIAARRINDKPYNGPHKFERAQQITLPVLAAFKPEGETRHDYFDYSRTYITDEYNMVYTEFVDWTDKKYLP